MEKIVSILFVGLFAAGCSRPSISRTFSPVRTNLEVYIVSNAGHGQASRPLDFRDYVPRHWDLTFTDGDAAYSVAIEYKGTQNERDYYLVTLTAPQGAVGVPAPAEIAYDGRQTEIWKDSKESIGFRPLK